MLSAKTAEIDLRAIENVDGQPTEWIAFFIIEKSKSDLYAGADTDFGGYDHFVDLGRNFGSGAG